MTLKSTNSLSQWSQLNCKTSRRYARAAVCVTCIFFLFYINYVYVRPNTALDSNLLYLNSDYKFNSHLNDIDTSSGTQELLSHSKILNSKVQNEGPSQLLNKMAVDSAPQKLINNGNVIKKRNFKASPNFKQSEDAINDQQTQEENLNRKNQMKRLPRKRNRFDHQDSNAEEEGLNIIHKKRFHDGNSKLFNNNDAQEVDEE